MQRSNGARILPLLVIVIVVVLLVAAIVAAGRAVFSGGNSATQTTEVTNRGRDALLKVNMEQSVSMTVRGPITADETFTSYKITVSPDERDMGVYRGYGETRIRGKKLDNTTAAYEQFVYALDKANMMKGTVPEDDAKNDLRGICAVGYVYEFSVMTNGDEVKTLWTSTCGGSPGSLDASKEQLSALFRAQIPGSEDLAPFRTPINFRY